MRNGWLAVAVAALGCDGNGDLTVGRAADLDELTDRVEALEAQVVPTAVVADVPCAQGSAYLPFTIPDLDHTPVQVMRRYAGEAGRGLVDARDVSVFNDRVEVHCDDGLVVTVIARGPGVAARPQG